MHLVPRPNLGGDSIYTFHLIHSRPRYTFHEETATLSTVGLFAPIVATLLGIEKFDSNVFHLLNLAKAFLIWFYTHSHLVLCPFCHG